MRMLALMLPGVLLLAAVLAAQDNSATVRGILTDTSGAVIPGATVSLATGRMVKSAVTQTDGSYTFIGLAPGEYTVKVAFPGFDAFEKALTAVPGQSAPFAIQLTPSGGTQQVTVSGGGGPELSTDPADSHSALVL